MDNKCKNKIKVLIDILMTIGLLFMSGYQIWGLAAHEYVGIIMLVLFVAHHILNWRWYKSIFNGKYNTRRLLMIAVNTALLVIMALQMYSGIVMSRHALGFLPIDGGMGLARRLHILGAYWGLVLMSLHLGFHWNKMANALPGYGKSRWFKIIGILIAIYGVVAFIKRDFITYMFLRSEFVFLDFNESAVLFYFDYISIMGLFIFIGHYLMKYEWRIRK